MKRHVLKRISLSMVFFLGINWSGLAPLPIIYAATPSTSIDREKAVERLERLFKALEAAQKEIPRDTFDPKAIIEKVGTDPTKLFEWVRDNTILVPYKGVLRNAAGVLMDRVGNSLDRALLLHKLLTLAGHDARLARGELTEAQASDLLADSRPIPDPNTGKAAESSDIEQVIERFADEFGLNANELRRTIEVNRLRQQRTVEEVSQRVAEQTEALIAAVGLPDPTPEEEERAWQRKALQDQWWVQWKKGSRWVDFDPTYSNAQPNQPLTKANTTIQPKEIDRDLYHKVTIRVVGEIAKKGKLKETVLLSQELVPYRLLDKRIVLNHVPLNWPEDLDLFQEEEPRKRLKETLLEQYEWMPVLTVDSQKYYEKIITIEGDIFDSADFHPTTTRLGTYVGKASDKAVGEMTELLRNLPGGSEEVQKESTQKEMISRDSHLTAEWIEYEIHSPSRLAHTIRRQIFDLLGPAVRTSGRLLIENRIGGQHLNISLALIGETEILPIVSKLTFAFMGYLRADALLKNKGLIIQALFDENAKVKDYRSAEITALPGPTYDLAVARSSWGRFGDRIYLDRPNLISMHRGVSQISEAHVQVFEAFDIVHNHVAVRGDSKNMPFMLRLEQGVIDTNAEAFLSLSCKNLNAGSTFIAKSNIADFYDESIAFGVHWITIKSLENPVWEKLDLPQNIRIIVEGELKKGYTILVPQRANKPLRYNTFGWWRIDHRTGQTLGFDARGWGVAYTEYMNALINVLTFGFCIGTAEATIQYIYCSIGLAAGFTGAFAPTLAARFPGSVFGQVRLDAITALFTLLAAELYGVGAALQPR